MLCLRGYWMWDMSRHLIHQTRHLHTMRCRNSVAIAGKSRDSVVFQSIRWRSIINHYTRSTAKAQKLYQKHKSVKGIFNTIVYTSCWSRQTSSYQPSPPQSSAHVNTKTVPQFIPQVLVISASIDLNSKLAIEKAPWHRYATLTRRSWRVDRCTSD